MMPGIYTWDVKYDFHAVGQGLFSTGLLACEHVEFRWVYDCGTVSAQHLLTTQIDCYHRQLPRPAEALPFIDLLVISHFDKDHISGVVELLQHCNVRNIVLPYMPLWQRLVIAFEERSGSRSPLTQFLLDPVGFLRTASRGTIERIILVMPVNTRPDEPNLGQEPLLPDVPPDAELDEISSALVFDELPEHELQGDEELTTIISGNITRAAGTPQVVAVRSGSALSIHKIWEFVPYNDASMVRFKNSKFEKAVRIHTNNLKNSTKRQIKEAALADLKKTYTNTFGNSSRHCNVISLFLYSGPVYGAIVTVFMPEDEKYHSDLNPKYHLLDRVSILYTGDGYLNSLKSIDDLMTVLGAYRCGQLSVFQVMHHGARGNWKAGIADTLMPDYSIFSSDPEAARTGHPHAEVLRDFWNYHPIQVDKNYSAHFIARGWYIFPPRAGKRRVFKRI